MELSEITSIIKIAEFLYKVIRDFFLNKGENEIVKKLEESKEEILKRLDQITSKSKEKFDQQINIMADKVLVQNYYNSPRYSIELGNYALASASQSIDFLVGKSPATPSLPDPGPYVRSIEKSLDRIADVLEQQYRKNHTPKVKVTRGAARHGEEYTIYIENKGEEPIDLRRILVKRKCKGQQGDYNCFSVPQEKRLFKNDPAYRMVVTIPKGDMKSNAPDTFTEEQKGNILSFVDIEAEIHYMDSQGKEYKESLELL
jgi:hypothetical protein